MESLAQLGSLIAALYFAIGAIFSVLFLLWGVSRIDSAARGASLSFRFFILPGVITLWPLLLLRFVLSRPQDHGR